MVRAEVHVEIAASPERAFAFVSDLENDEKWVANWTSKRTSATNGPGATYQRWYRLPFGMTKEASVVVTTFEPATKFAFESRVGSGVAVIEYHFQPAGAGVRVTKIEELRHGGVIGLINRVFGFMLRREAAKLMASLKRALESASA